MKFTWEPNDIKAGRRVKASDSEEFIIGYDPALDENHLAVVSLSDGMILKANVNTVEIARFFSENGYAPLTLPPTAKP